MPSTPADKSANWRFFDTPPDESVWGWHALAAPEVSNEHGVAPLLQTRGAFGTQFGYEEGERKSRVGARGKEHESKKRATGDWTACDR